MNEVELSSELMILMLDGIQDKKKSIDAFYERYDEEFPDQERIGQRFRATIDVLTESVGDELRFSSGSALLFPVFCDVPQDVWRPMSIS
jgi:hypothetical protein